MGENNLTKDGSDLRDIIIMNSGNTINLFGNPNMITNKQTKTDIPMNFLANSGSKIVDEV